MRTEIYLLTYIVVGLAGFTLIYYVCKRTLFDSILNPNKKHGKQKMDDLIVYVDMDDCLCNYTKSYLQYKKEQPDVKYPQSILGIFEGLEPMKGAIETVVWLSEQNNFDVYILTAPSIMNKHCYSEKASWVEKHLGIKFVERLIISPHKNLNRGDFLIDDCTSGRGQEHFEGQLIHFGSDDYPNWNVVKKYFEKISSDHNK